MATTRIANNLHHLIPRTVQTGGTVGSPTVSAPIYMPSSVTGDAISTSGSTTVVVAGSSGGFCKVQTTLSDPREILAGTAIWVSLTDWLPNGPFTGATATFGSGDNSAGMIILSSSFVAFRLLSWGTGQVQMEILV